MSQSSSITTRWLTNLASKIPGVEISVFQARSKQAADSIKAAMSEVTVQDILKAAD